MSIIKKGRFVVFLLTLILPAFSQLNAQTFSSLSSATFPAPLASARVIVADFDNDVDADILYQTGGDGTAFQFARSNGNGTFTIQALSSSPFAGLTLPNHNGSNYHVADFDRDGDLDLWGAVNGTTGSYFKNNNGVFVSESSSTFPAPASAGRIVAGDFDKDGDDDILYQTGGNGSAFQFARNNGNGTFVIQAQSASPFAAVVLIDHTASNYHVADFDGDGDLDVWAAVNGATGNYYRNNNGVFSSESTATFPAPLGSARAIAGDFDTDGDADILYQTGGDGTAFQYARSNGDGTFTILTQAASPFASVTLENHNGNNYQIADYDKDGDQDVWAAKNAATGSFYSKDGATPLLVSFSPVNNSSGQSRNVNVTYTFSESVTKGTGNITISRVSDNVVAESIPVTSAQVTGSGTTWTIDPLVTLAPSTLYAVTSASGTWKNVSGIIFSGVTLNTTQRFTTATEVSSVSVPANKTYKAGDVLSFTVNTTGIANVNTSGGTPRIAIVIGATTRFANYVSGNGTNALVFSYTIASGEVDTDGITIGTLSLNGGTIKDVGSADVILTLNNVGSTTGVLIDAVAPAVTSINRQIPSTTLTKATSLTYRVSFSESVSGVDITDFAITSTGSATASVASVTASTGTTIDVSLNNVAGDGTLRLDLKATGTGIIDVAGNPIAGAFTTGQTYTIDNTAPIITSNGGGANATISVAENLTAVTTVVATDANPITYSIAGGVDQAKFNINTSTGVLVFVTAPDYEMPTDADANNSYLVTVRATDGLNNKDQNITVNVTDVNDNAPVIISNGGGATATISLPEGSTNVTKVIATDADAGTVIIYSFNGGADVSKFNINSATGDVTFKTPPIFLLPTDADGNNSYLVTVRASDGLFNDDQALTINVTPGALPVVLYDFKGQKTTLGIELNWKTTAEIGFDRFEIERSESATNFVRVGEAKAVGGVSGTKTYQWLDKNLEAANYFYRLKMIDKDGTITHSTVLRVTVLSSRGRIYVSPNPITNRKINLQLSDVEKGLYQVKITNASGRLVYSSKINHAGGSGLQIMEIPARNGNGWFILSLEGAAASYSTKLLLR